MRVAQQGREGTESEETVLEEALELSQLSGGKHDALGGHGIAQRGAEMIAARASVRRIAETCDDRPLEAGADGLGDHDASMWRSSARSSYARPS